ncbi:MAG: RDD family protein [Alphaproteobacteria bacterium]|jgi:uncharacterized RDD family membrane protein YckC
MTETSSSGANYAGFWTRVVAYIIDIVVLAVPMIVVSIVFPSAVDASGMPSGPSLVGSLIGAAILIAYVGLLESSAKQATLGKMAMGLKVTSTDGARLSLGQAIFRAWPYYAAGVAGALDALVGTGMIISFIMVFVVFFACVMVAFTAKKQGLHDMIASTLVVKK